MVTRNESLHGAFTQTAVTFTQFAEESRKNRKKAGENSFYPRKYGCYGK